MRPGGLQWGKSLVGFMWVSEVLDLQFRKLISANVWRLDSKGMRPPDTAGRRMMQYPWQELLRMWTRFAV